MAGVDPKNCAAALLLVRVSAVVVFTRMAQTRESLRTASGDSAGFRVTTSSPSTPATPRFSHRPTSSMSSKDAVAGASVSHGTPDNGKIDAGPRSPVWPAVAKYPLLKQRLFILLEDPTKSVAGTCISFFIMTTIVTSVAAFVLETEPVFRSRSYNSNWSEDVCRSTRAAINCEPQPDPIFFVIETVCIVIFTVEYALRILTVHSMRSTDAGLQPAAPAAGGTSMASHADMPSSPIETKQLHRLPLTLRYALMPLNVIDLLAILPFYLKIIDVGGGNFAVVRVLRLVRVFRVFKVAKYNSGMVMLKNVFVQALPALYILFFYSILIGIFLAALIYFCEGTRFSVSTHVHTEHAAHPCMKNDVLGSQTCEEFVQVTTEWAGLYVRTTLDGSGIEETPFRSILGCLWWVFTTMSTVGYGDTYPTTPLGKVVGVLAFLCGIMMITLPITVLGAEFDTLYDDYFKQVTGKRIEGDAGPTYDDTDSSGSGSGRTNVKLTAIDKLKLHKQMTSQHSKRNRMTTQLRSDAIAVAAKNSLKVKIFTTLDDPSFSPGAKFYGILMLLAIVTSTVTFLLETEPQFQETPAACRPGNYTKQNCEPQLRSDLKWLFLVIEYACLTFFTIDYVLRVATVHATRHIPERLDPDPGVWRHTRAYVTTGMNIIDLLAILPGLVTLLFPGISAGTAILRVLRLTRLFRVLRLPTYKKRLEMFSRVINKTLPALRLLFYMVTLVIVVFGSLVYYIEGAHYNTDPNLERDGHDFGNYTRSTLSGHGVELTPFTSISRTLWYIFVTITTVGYGDYYTTTVGGRACAIVVFYVGIIAIALPITVIGANFGREYFSLAQQEQEEKAVKVKQEKETEQVQTVTHIDRVVAPTDRVVAASSDLVHNPSSRSPLPSKQGSFNLEHAIV